MSGPRTVLVVEDSDEDFEVFERALRSFTDGLVMRRCLDGDEALDLLEGGLRPDVVVLDLNLPGTDGREVLETIKGDPEMQLLPVIVLTSSGLPGDVRGAYRAGANCYLAKPATPAQFDDAIQILRRFWLDTVLLGGSV